MSLRWNARWVPGMTIPPLSSLRQARPTCELQARFKANKRILNPFKSATKVEAPLQGSIFTKWLGTLRFLLYRSFHHDFYDRPQTRYTNRHCIQCISLATILRSPWPYYHFYVTSCHTDSGRFCTAALLVVKIKIWTMLPDLFRELFIELNVEILHQWRNIMI